MSTLYKVPHSCCSRNTKRSRPKGLEPRNQITRENSKHVGRLMTVDPVITTIGGYNSRWNLVWNSLYRLWRLWRTIWRNDWTILLDINDPRCHWWCQWCSRVQSQVSWTGVAASCYRAAMNVLFLLFRISKWAEPLGPSGSALGDRAKKKLPSHTHISCDSPAGEFLWLVSLWNLHSRLINTDD